MRPTALRPLLWLALILGLGACSTLPPGAAEQAAQPVPAVAPAAEVSKPLEMPAAVTPTATLAVLPAPPPAASEPAATPGVRPDPLRTLEGGEDEDPAARTDLWERLRRGLQMPDLQGELVSRWEQWYTSRPDYVARMTERGGRYLFHIVEEVERRGLPAELALLPFIESAFNPQAMSHARASGMWQFMPATGREFELRQNLFRDDRRDVLASTRAALDYLQSLHKMFGDWQLALAAYNWGQGNVQRAITRNQRAGLPAAYLDLKMPDETRNYLPKLQAVKNIVANPRAFGVALTPLQNHPFFLSVPIERDIDVALAARLAGLPLEDFQALNPQLNKPVILAAGTPQLLLPYDNANRFVRALKSHHGALASWTAWVAPRTMKAADAARAVGMGEGALRDANRIPPRMLVKAGSTLMVPRSPGSAHEVSEQVADHAILALAPERVAKARKGKAGPRAKGAPLATARAKGAPVVTARAKAPASGARAAQRAKPAPTGARTRVAQAAAPARR